MWLGAKATFGSSVKNCMSVWFPLVPTGATKHCLIGNLDNFDDTSYMIDSFRTYLYERKTIAFWFKLCRITGSFTSLKLFVTFCYIQIVK